MTRSTAIVTGAARGIGLATTDLFLAEGRRVVMVDRDADELASVAEARTNVLPVTCDVSDPAAVAASLERIEAVARSDENTMPVFIEAVENDVTLGEISDTLRKVWGTYQEAIIF